jgi:hypothetical protein
MFDAVKGGSLMDITVTKHIRSLPIGNRHRRIFDKFRKRCLFPLVKVVRLVEEDREIINVYTVDTELDIEGRHQMVARQVEIIRIPDTVRSEVTAA